MPNYRRNFVEGGSYFFTVVTERRARFLCTNLARTCLREAVTACQIRFHFETVAWVLLDDHLHTIWTLPKGDSNFSVRWAYLKKEFSKLYLANGGYEQARSLSKRTKRERGIWQRRFWEHTLQNEEDFQRHVDYIHYNPVKHGLVACPHMYPFSTFHAFVKREIYEPLWGCQVDMKFDDLEATVGE